VPHSFPVLCEKGGRETLNQSPTHERRSKTFALPRLTVPKPTARPMMLAKKMLVKILTSVRFRE